MDASVTVLICTRNRAESLRLTLDSLAAVAVPAGWAVELIVVDNGSTDHTNEVVAGFSMKGVPVRRVFEPRTGLSVARNTGVAEAKGDVLLFSDDDVRFPADWIEGMGRPILAGEAEAVQGGVRIAPHLERPWLTGALRTWVAAVEDPREGPEGLVGANMAIGAQTVRRLGGFDTRLGAGAAGFFEDTAMGWAVKSGGGRIAYRPDVAVVHHFSEDRLNVATYVSIARRMAESYALVAVGAGGRPDRPSAYSLAAQVPFLGVRVVTQGLRRMVGRGVDAGFIVRYHYFRRAIELRRALGPNGAAAGPARGPGTRTG